MRALRAAPPSDVVAHECLWPWRPRPAGQAVPPCMRGSRPVPACQHAVAPTIPFQPVVASSQGPLEAGVLRLAPTLLHRAALAWLYRPCVRASRSLGRRCFVIAVRSAAHYTGNDRAYGVCGGVGAAQTQIRYAPVDVGVGTDAHVPAVEGC